MKSPRYSICHIFISEKSVDKSGFVDESGCVKSEDGQYTDKKNLGAKKILVGLAKELEQFNGMSKMTAENKYKRMKSFVNYLKKNFPPKRGVLPKFPETKDKGKRSEQAKEGLKKLTRLYHPDINGKYGEDWAAYCDEISKIANNLYGKIVKGI